MDTKEGGFSDPRYLVFPKSDQKTGADGKPMLNKYSIDLTRGHDFPGAKVSVLVSCYHMEAKRTRLCCTPLVYQTRNRCRQNLTLGLLLYSGKVRLSCDNEAQPR